MPGKHSPGNEKLSALISVHDVMPETRRQIERILQRLDAVPPHAVALLIVPGRGWTPDDLGWLRALDQQGYTMIGHGWRHECDAPQTLKHRFHSRMISNRAAEHLSLSDTGINRLMSACDAWLRDAGLTPANVYIPPAWALGPITRESLKTTPFRYVETLGGVYDTRTDHLQRLPVAGFEADRQWRVIIMRLSNWINIRLSVWRQTPLRIAIHPHDWQYPLSDQLDRLLHRVDHYWSYLQVSDLPR